MYLLNEYFLYLLIYVSKLQSDGKIDAEGDMTYLFRSHVVSCQAGAKRGRVRNKPHSVSSLLNLVSVNNLPSKSKKVREA